MFEDPALPGRRFHCSHCLLVDGLLAAFPHLRESLNVHRVAFPRPRPAVIALVGEASQGLPVLVLPAGLQVSEPGGEAGGRQFVSGGRPITVALAELYGTPPPHP